MLRLLGSVLGLVSAILITGCAVRSVHPLCTAEQAVKDDRVVGVWTPAAEEGDETPAPNEVFTITAFPGATRVYGVEYTDRERSEKSVKLRMMLFKAGDHMFANVALADEERDRGHSNTFVVDVNMLGRVSLENDRLVLQPLNEEWLGKLLKDKPETLGNCFLDRGGVRTLDPDAASKTGSSQWSSFGERRSILLTASTPELQAFVIAHAGNAEAWSDSLKLKRLPVAVKIKKP